MWILTLLLLAAEIFAIVDIVVRGEWEVKHLPKIAWLFLVILVPLLGTILWLTVGRRYPDHVVQPRPRRAVAATRPPAATAGRSGAGGDPRSTEQQLADLEREIEEDRLRAEIARKRAEKDRPAGS